MAYLIQDAFRRYLNKWVSAAVMGDEFVSGELVQLGDGWIMLADRAKKREYVINTNKIVYLLCTYEERKAPIDSV